MPSTFTFEEALEAPPTTFDFEEAKQPDPEQPAPVEVPQEPTRARSRLSRFGSGFKEELIARPTTTSVPFLGGAVDFVDALTVYNAAKRVSKADTDGSEPSDKDLMVLKQFSDEQNRRRNLEGAEKVGSMVGGILLQLPAFAGELAATGGLYTAGRKIGQRLALKAAEKFIDDASKKALVKYGARIAGGMAGTALQAPAAGAQRIAAETVQRMTPQIAAGEDEAGKLRAIIKDNGDDFAPAVAKALGSQYVEVLSEHSGGMAGEVLGKVPGVAALQRLKEKVIAKWFQTHPSATIDELLKQLKERGAWHGMVNEMIEERLGEIGRIPIEGEYRPPDKEQLAAEAIGFSIPGAAAYGLRKLTGRKEPPDAIPERTPTPLPVGETPEDRPPLVPQVRQQTEAATSAVAPINPGGPVADLPPDLKALEAENAAKQRKIADDFKAETERKKSAGGVGAPETGAVDTIAGRIGLTEFEKKGYAPEQVTQQNWIDLQRAERRRLGQSEQSGPPAAPFQDYKSFHEDAVRRALAKGDTIDPDVLVDYPTLKSTPAVATTQPRGASLAQSDVESLLKVEVPSTDEARLRVKNVDSQQAQLRDDYRKAQDEIKTLEKTIKPQKGNPYTRSRIKTSAKKSDVERFHTLQKQAREIYDKIHSLDESARTDRRLIDQTVSADAVNDSKRRLSSRLVHRVSLWQDQNPGVQVPPELIKARDAEIYKELKSVFQDASDSELLAMRGEAERNAYFGDPITGAGLGPKLDIQASRRAELDAAVNAPDIRRDLFSEELQNKLDRFRAASREYGAKVSPDAPVEPITAKVLEELKSEILSETKRIQEELAAEQVKRTAEAEAEKAKEQQLIDEAKAIVASSGPRKAKEVKSELIARIKTALDELVAKDEVTLEQKEDGSYVAIGKTSGGFAFGEIEKVGDRFKVTTRQPNFKDSNIIVSVGTLAEAESIIKAMAASAPGKAVIGVPGDGLFRLVKDGWTMLKVWQDARKIETGEGGQNYRSVGGAEKPPSSITTVADWKAAKEYHGLEASDEISTWSPALLEIAKKINPKSPETVNAAAVDKWIENKRNAANKTGIEGASVNVPKETAGAPPTTVSGEQSPAAPIKPPTAAPDTRTAIEVLNQEKRVKVKMPSGATMLRVTTPDGKVSVQPLTNVVKGDNVFRGSGGSKVEAGTIDRFGKFLPSKGEVTVSRVEPPNPYKTDESEKNSERARSLKAKEVVVETEQEALDAMNRTREANGQEPLKSASLENGVAAYYDNGIIYYILDGIKSPEQFLAVQREEIAHHINSSPQAKKVLSELGRAQEFELERREIRGSYPQVQGETDAQYAERIANEMLAKSRVQDAGLFQRMMDWIIEKLSNVARIGNWIKESDTNRQAILRTISRRLESNFTAAGQTNVPMAAQAATESEEAENVRAQRGGIPEVGQERPSERIDEIRATVRELGFDGRVTITPENTERAWELFEAMTNPTRKGATAQDLKNQFGGTDMALGLLKNELEQYAFKLTAAGDRSLLVSMLNRSADFVTVLEGGDTAAARAMRAALESAEGPAWRGLKAVLTEERNRAAAQGLRLEASNYERLMRALDTFTVSEEEIVKAAREIPLPEGQTVGQAEPPMEAVLPPAAAPPTATAPEGQQAGTTEATPTTPGARRLRLSVTELAKRLLKTPYRTQLDPAWREKVARDFFEEAGLSPGEAAAAAKDFSTRFADVYAKAQERLAKQILKGSTPDTVSDVLKAIRAGVLDPKSPWADEFAKKAGWKKPTDEQIKRLLELDAKLSEEGISPAEVAAINEQMLQIVRVIGKHEAGFMKAMAERFVGGMLSGIRTITVQLAPIITTIRDLAIASGSDPKNTLNFARAIYEAAKNNIVSESKFAWQKDAYKFHLGELDLEHNQLKRIWQEAEEQYQKGGVRQKAWARTRQLFAINRFVFKTLNTIDNTMMSAVREWKVAYYASIAFKEAGISTRQIGELVDAMAMARQASFERWTDAGLDPTTAKVRANNDVLQAASDFIENRTGDESVALRVLDSAEKDAYSMVGRRAQGIAEADEGMLSRLFMNPFMEWQSKMRGEGGARGLIATALFGFVNIPYRTARFVSNFHPYGLLRYGINAYRNNRGMEPYWKQTFGNSMQERARLREAIAGTVVLGLATAWGMAFSSADDDDDKEGFRLYITGAGPKNKNLRDAWLKRGFKPYAMNFVVNGRHVTIPLTRVGEALMFPFMIPAALDDAAWRQKEAAAAGRPIKSPISLYTSSLVGTHLSMAGQKGLFQTAGRLMDSVQGGDSFLKASAKLGATVGSSIALPYRQMLASISEMFVGPLDQSSASALIAANMPIVGLPFQSKAVNRFGDQINDRSWYGRIFNTGVPVAFQVSKTPENETLYPAMVSGGFAPPELRRYILEERFGPLTNDEFSTFARKSGARLKADTLNNLPTLNAVAPEDAKKWLSQAATRADRQTELEMGLQRVNPLRAGGSTGGFSPILSSGGGNALPTASSARGGASGRTMASFGGGFGGSRRRRTSLRSFRTRGRSRLRRTRISRLSRRTRLRRPRLTASRIRRPRLTLA